MPSPRNRRRNAGRSSASCSPAWRTPPARHRLTWSFWRGTFLTASGPGRKQSRPSIRSWRSWRQRSFSPPATTTPTPPPPPTESFPGRTTYISSPRPPRPGWRCPSWGRWSTAVPLPPSTGWTAPWPASTPRRRTWPLSAAFMGTSPPPTAATAPSPTMKLPPRACTIWPWATATAPAA